MLKFASPLARVLTAASLALTLAACQSQSTKEETAKAAPLNNDDYYEVHHEGRIYVFDDAGVYKEYLSVGETPFRKVRIGVGPHGETVVFGLHKHDKKKMEGIASVDMFDGKIDGAQDGFYAEIRSEGRIYVFDNWDDVKSFRQVGEAPYRYTDIGAGPNGETVVYVLNKHNKKHRPDALIARFKAANP
ncbi:hypothetical protein [Endothiovibrio diazotrophicus]